MTGPEPTAPWRQRGWSALRRGWHAVRWPSTVRWHATIAASAVVGVGLLLGGFLLVLVLHNSLSATLQSTLETQVTQSAQLLRADGLAAFTQSNPSGASTRVVVQVIDPTGRVLYSSDPRLSGAITDDRRSTGGPPVVTGRTRLPLPGDLKDPLVVAEGVTVDGTTYVVAAAASQDVQEDAVSTTALLVAIAWPLLVALTGWVVWWRVGVALQSVDRIRRQVELVGAARLEERVPVPSSHDEVAALAETMNAMLARLQASQAAQRRFVADASHELRSPIATLTASLEVLRDEGPTSLADLEPVMDGEARRMARLVDHLLVLSRADDQALRPADHEVDLDDLVASECGRLSQLWTGDLQTQLAPVRVRGDEHQLAQVVSNLLDNAARHCRSRISVTVRQADELAFVVVEDDGDGIAPEDRERVFARFVRLDRSRSRASGGAGLGLAIARELARAHHGDVTVTASELGGAAFVVSLPMGNDAAGAPQPASVGQEAMP